jgi:hypothetical protein
LFLYCFYQIRQIVQKFISFTKFIYFYPQVPGQPMEFNHNQSGIQYKDEGPIQYFTVPTFTLTTRHILPIHYLYNWYILNLRKCFQLSIA